MTRRLLTPAEIIGITGDEPPLTAADITEFARRFYTPERAAAVFTGDREHARPSSSGAGGLGTFYNCDTRGMWAHTGSPRRAGHIPWRDLEAVLQRNATPSTERALVDANTAHRRHVAAWTQAWLDHRYGPGGGDGPAPTYDAVTGSRLRAAAERALADLLHGPVQDALFTIGTPA